MKQLHVEKSYATTGMTLVYTVTGPFMMNDYYRFTSRHVTSRHASRL